MNFIQMIKKPPDYQVNYGIFHKRRFQFLLNVLNKSVEKQDRILEIGVSEFTVTLRKYYENISTLDLFGRSLEMNDFLFDVEHIIFDLNESINKDNWLVIEQKFDVVIFAEVIEHLPISPEHTMRFICSLLNDNGKVILQTPNATSFRKRLKMLFGHNPFERIRNDAGKGHSHGHIREYTKKELFEICISSGFHVISHSYKNYFNSSVLFKKPFNFLNKFFFFFTGIIPSFREGQTIVLLKNSNNI